MNIGMSWDEPQNHWQGAIRANYLKSFEFGKFKFIPGGWSEVEPGLYDTFHFFIADLLLKIFPGKLIGIKHLINLTFSFSALIGLFVISKKLFNKEVAYLATFLCLINPFFFGHISINPKDTISCFALVWLSYSSYMYCINFEKKRYRFLLLASFFMGIGVGTRLPFYVVPIPIFISAITYILVVYKNKFKEFHVPGRLFLDFLIFSSITFFLMVLAWPYVHVSPDILFKAFTSYVLYPHGPVLEIMNGNYFETSNTPRSYFFNFFIFRFPIYILILFFAFIALLKIDLKFFISKFSNFKKKIIIIFSIIFFPILLHLILQVKIYNGIRLFLFIIPFLSLLSAISLYYLLNNFKKSIYTKSLTTIIIIFFLFFFQRFFYLTPYHYDYSNFFNIKFSNTKKMYIHDYWGTSYKELMKLIGSNKNLKDIKADYCGGDGHGLKYLAKKHSRGKVTLVPYNQADYIIMIDTVSNDINKKSSCFTQRPGKDIVSVKRLGVTFSVLRKLEK
jgi:hypothetical protein